MRRDPNGQRYFCASPSNEGEVALLGGDTFNGVTITSCQKRDLLSYYGYDLQVLRRESEELVKQNEEQYKSDLKQWAKQGYRYQNSGLAHRPQQDLTTVEESYSFSEAAALRNMWRHTQHDGLRVMAFLSRFISSHEDPVELLQQTLNTVGYDAGWDDWGDKESDPLEFSNLK